ncbi:CNNM domain-containing protein [Sinomonas sp. ASV322]|uniref:CNNM domain-containing protein n=1 Tax=Sinomonas sp. ASV322 TaxID=3041920 RepID=UPI0027DD8B93|nr:CNNM domain-containing protein [Sinomonas sp. ASV322]MDQ4501099.1 CNNM domain-containing protein [Sinomonas sp. ASV322]
MTIAVLLALALAFTALAALLTAAESALAFLPRHEAEERIEQGRAQSLAVILASPVPHVRALRFWRIWFETASAVVVAVVMTTWLGNVWLAVLAATIVMALIGFLLVGVSPRQLGRRHALAVALWSAPLTTFLRRVLGPIPGWLVSVGSAATGTDPTQEDAIYSTDELREFVERASDSEDFEEDQAELLQSVFELGETLVRAVMIPRTDVIAIEAGSSLRQAMSLFLRSGCSRVPVYVENLDDVRGVLYLKDVAARLHQAPEAEDDAVEYYVREPRFVPESKPVNELLKELQRESTHLAIVVDEYGGTAGLVTLEDLIEELVGEIADEYDEEDAEALEIEPGVFRIPARMSLDDLGELFDEDVEDDEVDTAGGLLAKALGRVPIVGSTAEVDGIQLTAERLEGRRKRVSHLLAQRSEESAPAGDTHASEDERHNSDRRAERHDAERRNAERHNAERHNAERHNAERHNAERHNTDTTGRQHG